MSSPIRSPEGNWWYWPVAREEKWWLGLVVLTGLVLFAWMFGWMYAGDQNPTGPTYRTSPERFQEKMATYRRAAGRTELGLSPSGEEVYVAAAQFGWNGLPVVLEAGKPYRLHLTSYDVQHGFSVRPEAGLWKQINLQALPGYEWVVPMTFEEPGTYYVVCNEFCGLGHRVMTARFHVVERGAAALGQEGTSVRRAGTALRHGGTALQRAGTALGQGETAVGEGPDPGGGGSGSSVDASTLVSEGS